MIAILGMGLTAICSDPDVVALPEPKSKTRPAKAVRNGSP